MKKVSFANFCAYLSLALSVVLLVLWCCNVGGFTVVTLETFVGVIVSLLAIIVTLAIVWQIYNAIEMKKNIEELKLLETRLSKQEKSLKQVKFNADHEIYNLLSYSAMTGNSLVAAFRFSLLSLENALQLENPRHVEILLERMSLLVNKIPHGTMDSYGQLDRIMKSDKIIKGLPNYNLIKKSYEPIIEGLNLKVTKV